MGRPYGDAEVDRLSALFSAFTGGIAQFPQWDIPFTKYGRAMQARPGLRGLCLSVFFMCACVGVGSVHASQWDLPFTKYRAGGGGGAAHWQGCVGLCWSVWVCGGPGLCVGGTLRVSFMFWAVGRGLCAVGCAFVVCVLVGSVFLCLCVRYNLECACEPGCVRWGGALHRTS
jgi:hypothetical protein